MSKENNSFFGLAANDVFYFTVIATEYPWESLLNKTDLYCLKDNEIKQTILFTR